MTREQLGEVTCPSGTLVTVDFGLLGMWSHREPPLLADWIAGPETAQKANSCVDYAVEGPDLVEATRIFGLAPGWLYDRRPDFDVVFAAALEEHELRATLNPLTERIPHGQRIQNALSSGVPFAAAEFHGLWAPLLANVPTSRPLRVFATRVDDGAHAGRWRHVELEVRPGEAASTEDIGDVPVDCARLGFADAEALAAWQHDESFDGKADFVFWGRDAAEAAATSAAPALPDGQYGWLDMDVEQVVSLGTAVEALRAEGDLEFATDFRPHSHHYRMMQQVRASPLEAGTLQVGDSTMCGFMTSWGDGVFRVERDIDAAGETLTLRVLLEETGTRNMAAANYD